MILSVSRRTDIPAFYSDWFMKRLRAGFVYVRNPVNPRVVSLVPLSPENVDCIVFWTKDPRKLMPYLDEIDGMGYRYYFHFTITGYGRDIERNMPDKRLITDSFTALSRRIGREKVILRYDPIFFTDRYSAAFHIKAFERLLLLLHAYTDKVIISFLDMYRRTVRNMSGIGLRSMTEADMRKLAAAFADIAGKYGLKLETCAESIDLSVYGIGHARCIDGELVERITGYGIRGKSGREAARPFCGCMKSVDIGQYDTCAHGCVYCYANSKAGLALKNNSSHDSESPLLCGPFCENEVKRRIHGVDSIRESRI